MGQTLAEKIFARHAGAEVHAGDVILADLDYVMAHDTTGAWALAPFREIATTVFDPERIIIPFDHAFPAPSVAMAKLQAEVRAFADEHGIEVLTDGVCHQLMAERYLVPGMLMLGADSHSPTGGGLGCLTIGVGSTDAAVAMATGKAWFRVPETLRVRIDGGLQPGVYAKDVILELAGTLGPAGGNYRVLEFVGSTIEGFAVPERLTLCNMSAELGCKAAIVPADDHTADYLERMGRPTEFERLRSDADASFEREISYTVDDLVPLIACPHDVDQVVPVTEVQGKKVDQVFVGSCTNCRIEDLEIVHSIWRGRKIAKRTRAVVTPASRAVYEEALRRGYLEEFSRAGAMITTPGCGACLGRQGGVLFDHEVCVSTSNRNFKGRMGSPLAEIYLASPATAAVTALTGVITDPRAVAAEVIGS
jgi:3-isopropylmalate dehydratase large subunit